MSTCQLGLVRSPAGADNGRGAGRIAAALADHPDAKVLDQKEFEKEAAASSTSCSPSSR